MRLVRRALTEHLVAAAGAAPGAEGAAPHAQSAPGGGAGAAQDDNVVDAEFKEVKKG